ncbi:hypothetical protein QUA82_09790 [Microcoleus sp. F8-D3]
MNKIKLDRCGNWYHLKIWPDGYGTGKRRFIDIETGIPAFCNIDSKSKAWHLTWWQPRHERIAGRMAKMMIDD